jgi:hypothetical protein
MAMVDYKDFAANQDSGSDLHIVSRSDMRPTAHVYVISDDNPGRIRVAIKASHRFKPKSFSGLEAFADADAG